MSTTFGPLDTDATNTCDICHDDTLMGFEMVVPGRCKNCQPANLPVLAQPIMCHLPVEVLRWHVRFWELVAMAANTFDDVYYASRARDMILEHIEVFEPSMGWCPDMPPIEEIEQEPLPAMIEMAPVPTVCAQAEIDAAYRDLTPGLARLTTWRNVVEEVIADWMDQHGLELGEGRMTQDGHHQQFVYDLVEQRDGETVGTIEYAY